MTAEHIQNESKLLSETDIHFFGKPDVRFHFNSGRNTGPEPKTNDVPDGEPTSEVIDATPCPTIDVYDMGDYLNVVIHLPNPDPIVMDWFRVEDDYQEFFNVFTDSLDEGYNGIKEITEFSDDGTELGEMIRESLESRTPDSVSVPQSKTVA